MMTHFLHRARRQSGTVRYRRTLMGTDTTNTLRPIALDGISNTEWGSSVEDGPKENQTNVLIESIHVKILKWITCYTCNIYIWKFCFQLNLHALQCLYSSYISYMRSWHTFTSDWIISFFFNLKSIKCKIKDKYLQKQLYFQSQDKGSPQSTLTESFVL